MSLRLVGSSGTITLQIGHSIIAGVRLLFFRSYSLPKQTSTAFTLVGFGGVVYNQTDSGGWVASTTSILTGLSTNELSFVHDRDLVAVFDGQSTAIFKSTNGAQWTRFGIASGTQATLSSLSTGGLSSGEYEIAYSYKARGLAALSNGSSGSTLTLAASSGAINVVMPNSTDSQVQALVVYARKVSAGDSVLRKVSSLAQSAGVSSTLVVTSTAWTTNDEVPTDHNLPSAMSFGVVWKNRWWGRSATVTNRLHFTQLFQPQSWPALFYVDIPFERGDAIQALVPLGDTLLIFGTTKIFVIIGQTSLDFEVRPTLASQDGALGFRAVAAIENGVVHAGASGVYIFDGTTDKLLSFDIDPGWRDFISNTATSALARVGVVYHHRDKELRVSVGRRYPSGAAGEWIMDLNRTRTTQTPAWTATDRTIGGYLLWDGPEVEAGNRGRLLSWATATGQLFQENVGTTANSSNLTAQYEGPGLTLGTFRGNWPDIRGEYEPHSGALSIEPVIDGVSQGTQSVNIGAGLSVYGTAVYGTATYAGVGRRQWYKTLPLSANGRTFELKLTYVGQETFKVFAYHVGVVPETASRGFGE